MAFSAYFDIDLQKALREQLVASFEQIETGNLNLENLNTVPREKGVYQLFHQGRLVYVGKANKLHSRLSNHRRKIEGRANISLAQVSFKCLWMSQNWVTLAPEAQLIAEYRSRGDALWNGNGFGPNDPGAGREDRNKPPALFDQEYPIRADWPCEFIAPGTWNAGELLGAMKRSLPYLLRFQKGGPDYASTSVSIPASGMAASEILRATAAALPEGWQATRFASHMILYKKFRDFRYGTVIYPG